MPKSHETVYLDYCAALECQAADKLGRELSAIELAGIRNAGSGMMLEAVDRSILYTTDLTELADSLEKGGVGFESRRAELCKSAVNVLEKQLGRSLNALEKQTVEGCRYWTEVLRLAVDLGACGSWWPSSLRRQREIVFAKFLQSSSHDLD